MYVCVFPRTIKHHSVPQQHLNFYFHHVYNRYFTPAKSGRKTQTSQTRAAAASTSVPSTSKSGSTTATATSSSAAPAAATGGAENYSKKITRKPSHDDSDFCDDDDAEG